MMVWEMITNMKPKKIFEIERAEADKAYQRIKKVLTDEGKLVVPDSGKYYYYGKILEMDGVYDEDYGGGTDLIQIGIKDKDGEIYLSWINLVEWCINAKRVNQIDTPLQYLDFGEDIEGFLIDVKRFDDKLILTFSMQVKIEIPYSQTSEEQLIQSLGKKVKILRTNSTNTPYRFTIENKKTIVDLKSTDEKKGGS